MLRYKFEGRTFTCNEVRLYSCIDTFTEEKHNHFNADNIWLHNKYFYSDTFADNSLCVHSNTALKFKLKIFVLDLSISISCNFIADNTDTFT